MTGVIAEPHRHARYDGLEIGGVRVDTGEFVHVAIGAAPHPRADQPAR
ncbi:hypothetical protein [Amycolatopsis nalaikhensis]|uniref:Uncharacterized protein n=1 Tax=Amycolatopsis nalaikhensis TaxID=715472 RepID=A0ABY8XTK4_9PSEU|nr:hypothetical protein [Amycolatopsis sp. 2-2]WIV59025.1 hypothetical protein QP939_10535 [Amycolatopsis sp. 2-2]